MKKIDELTEDEDMDPETRVSQLISCYKSELCIPEEKSTEAETLAERLKKAHEFFDAERVCLKYSRKRYDSVLRNALCDVYLKHKENTNRYELCTILNSEEDNFLSNYVDALKIIFSNIWEAAMSSLDPNKATLTEICEKAIEFADEIVKNMSICIVLTENENDANKLFEVLNNRALEVEDLELIKNHFYKEYCTKSSDSDDERDKRITELDELWADKIFTGNGDMRTKLISYLAAVYLTCDDELGYKDDAKLKDAIEKNYSNKYYLNGSKYNYSNILEDFNVYYAIKIILDMFDVKAQKLAEVSLRAEQEEKSISYKTMHLLNAMKYHAVIPALTNVIISTYAQNNSLTDSNFETSFKNFIANLLKDKDHTDTNYEKIHKCAYMLWIATLKGKDFRIPRNIAKRIIKEYGHVGYSTNSMDLLGEEISELNKELDDWLKEWTYSSNKTFAIKVLLLNLLISSRCPDTGGYKADRVDITVRSALAYRLDAGKLQLDHLEANVVNPALSSHYYLSGDPEKRQKIINGYLGNFMILDAADNNQKKNVPLHSAMQFYGKIDKCWLIKDINEMLKDSKYFDVTTNLPTDEFFNERTKRLHKYIKAFLNRQMNQNVITIDF